MKKLILTLALVGVSAVAFGQGTVNIENDQHVVQLTTDTSKLLFADQVSGWPGSAIPVPNDSGGLIPSGKSIVVGLYGGTSSGSLSLLTTLPLSNDQNTFTDGVISPNGFTLPFAGGSPAFFIFAAWDGAFASEAAAQAGGSYYGDSGVFTVTPSSGTTLPASIQTASWTGGPVILTAVVPEPSTFALAGLGAAALLIFRRRK
jgi:hypothetical protein